MSNYTSTICLKSLGKKHDCRIKKQTIFILTKGRYNDLGNSSWGKIDYLTQLGYRIQKVSSFI